MEKTRIFIWLFWVAVVLGLSLGIEKSCSIIKENGQLHDQVDQLQIALASSVVTVKHDTIRDSVPVASQPVIVVDKSAYKELEASKELIKDLQLRISQVESENNTLLATQGQVDFKSAADSDSILRYKDKWCNFVYLVKAKQLRYSVLDSLTSIVSRQYKHKFLWWRWGTKGYQVHIVSHNPNAQVVYNRYIKVEH